MKLDGRVAIVTGGGVGIGRAIALRFAQEGAAVTVAGRTMDSLADVATEIKRLGGRALATVADVSDEANVKRMVAATIEEFGAIDILVNNAGIAGPTAPATNISREDWDHTLAVNLTGAFLCAKHALPHMVERRSGRIINITSVAGLRAYALRSPYAASKWAMIGLTETLAEEAGRALIAAPTTDQDTGAASGITVNAIAPGPIRGPRIERVIQNRAAEMGRSFEDVEREYLQHTILGRMATEKDIAALAVFLASDEARNITGQTIACGG